MTVLEMISSKEGKVKGPISPRDFFAKLYEESGSDTIGRDDGEADEESSISVRPSITVPSYTWNFHPSGFLPFPAWKFSGSTESNNFCHVGASEENFQFVSGNQVSSSSFFIPPALNSFLNRRRRGIGDGKIRRQRTTFSQDQTLNLELEFSKTEYISRSRRCELATNLGLTETQIKIWFQNRRAKDKRLEKAQVDQNVFSLLQQCFPSSTSTASLGE